MDKLIIILLGPPGSGKGSQAPFLQNKYSLVHISTGALLREEIATKSNLGNKIKSIINSGNLLDDVTITQLLMEPLSKGKNGKGFIIDGYPRTLHQAELLNDILNNLNLNKNVFVLEFSVHDEIILKRILGRFSCAKCGAIYNKYYKQTKVFGVCDECHSDDFVFRKDDNEEVLKTRLKEYHSNIKPLLAYYEEKKCRFRIEASEKLEDIFNQITKIIK